MKTYISLFVIVITFGCFSCDYELPEITLPPDPEPPLDSLLLWKRPLHKDTLSVLSVDNITLYQDRIVTSASLTFGGEDEIVLCYDTSGVLQWIWEDYEAINNVKSISDEGSIGQYFFFTTYYESHCLNILTGEEVWRYITDEGSPRINTDRRHNIYKPIDYSRSAPRSDSTAIFRANVTNGKFQEVFKIRRTKGDAVKIPSIASYMNEEGEEILVFQNDILYMPTEYKEVIDLYSYNLTRKELMWHIEDITGLSWNVHLPQIDENNIYFATKYRFYSFDKETGKKNWERKMPHDFQGSNYLLYKDLLITNLDNGDLIAISKHSGQTVWYKKRLSACCVKLRIYDGNIYFGNGDIFIVDAQTGELLHRYTSSTGKEIGAGDDYFLNGIAVDTENKRMYATDGYYLMCLKIPESVD